MAAWMTKIPAAESSRHGETIYPSGCDTVLLVSDDAELVPELTRPLTDAGMRVVACDRCTEARAFLLSSPPNVVAGVLGPNDNDFPRLLAAVKEHDSSIPFVVVAGKQDRDASLGLLDAGAYDLVELPVDPRMFMFAMRRAIDHCRLRHYDRDRERLIQVKVAEKTVEITRTRDFLQGILDSSTKVSVVLTDLDQNVLFWNSGAQNIFGYTPEEMIGAKITRLYPKDAITEETVRDLQEMVRGKSGTVHGKMRQITKDGRVLVILLSITPMLDTLGDVQGILGIGQDVTEETRLTEELQQSFELIKKTQDVSIFSLAKLAESRDEETGLHLTRMQQYCRVLCEGLARRESHASVMTQRYIDDLVRSSVLHDIGKVAIPDSILMTDRKFTEEDYKIMKLHPIHGGRALKEAADRLGEHSFLSMGSDVAYYHHERWDGNGYPFGLKGEEIPLSARIVALADVYDALTTQRRYKRAFSHEEAAGIIVEGGGKHFDPVLVDVFQDMESEFQHVKSLFSEPAPST